MHRRPVLIDLDLRHLLLPAFVSILHRLSGVLLFFFIPVLLWLLDKSLQSAESFELLKQQFASPWILFFIWVFLSAFVLHLFAGIRHMLMDMHIGESKQGGKIGAMIVLLLFAFVTFFVAVFLIM